MNEDQVEEKNQEKKKKGWSNKEWDSTFTLGGIVLSYVVLTAIGAVLSFRTEDGSVPTGVLTMYQGAKELMLVVAGYFFRKTQESGQGGNGEGGKN